MLFVTAQMLSTMHIKTTVHINNYTNDSTGNTNNTLMTQNCTPTNKTAKNVTKTKIINQ